MLTSHRAMAPQQREALGISDGLIRVSVGIEAVADIIADFGQALAQA
ncbi:MAG TPA: PLP-dependent transferase [Symbiobacteriaceae bacterium]|nr:PLP-dependent transferase [Symbiobacteriaceae bacterium]